MAETKNAIKLTEGESITYTITLMRDGSAVDLSADGGYTVKMYAHDAGLPKGTNQINEAAVTLVDAGANGVMTYLFTTANTTIAGTDTDLKGSWRVNFYNVSVSADEWSNKETFEIERNEMVA